jgi:hypothetical protein
MKFVLGLVLVAQVAFGQYSELQSENKKVVVAVLAPDEIMKQVEGTVLGVVDINGEKFTQKKDQKGEIFLVRDEKKGKVKVNKHGIYFFNPITEDEGADEGYGATLQRQGWFNLGLALGGVSSGAINGVNSHPGGNGAVGELTFSYRPLQYKHLNTGVSFMKVEGPDLQQSSDDPKDLESKGSFVSSGRQFFIEHDIIAGGEGHDRDMEIDTMFALSGGFYIGSYAMKQVTPTLVQSTKQTVNGQQTSNSIQFAESSLGRKTDKGVFVRGRLIINGGDLFLRYDHGSNKRFTTGVTFSFGGPGSLVHPGR